MKMTPDPSFPKCQPREGMWELLTPELLHEVVLRDLLWSNNLAVEQQLLLWKEPGIRGKQEVLQLCKEMRLMLVESKGCSVWNFFFQVVVLKKGNKQSKETSLPAFLQRPFLGKGWPLASFATKELARTSYF